MTTRTITGLFDSRAEAERAAADLASRAGLPPSRIHLHGSEPDDEAHMTGGTESRTDKGFWAALRDIFVPDTDRAVYEEGVRRGGVLVSADVTDDDAEVAMDILEEHGAIDLDEREREWRSAGWTGGTDVTGAGSEASMPDMASGEVAPAGRTGGHGTGTEERIPLAEEEIQVGKRDVTRGRVRVRSYVVETPVQEQVRLREERVEVERRPADRPVAPGTDAPFRERTIEATEHVEEPVVRKEARVTGEVVVNREADERVATVEDRVRRTEVDVERDAEETGRATGEGRTPRR